ncbi:HATPase_c domain-containing protein [Rubrivivax sp. A210]|uniref:ATP-binding protein n=1 Tax=Rubrivivax sp. A210 TaxID=2772301 RepID=UPI00191B52FC|nr:ATP-binding protein [Rubrivivax sp. A210]CAD5375094.1 HATPase_c domain-containing protein [Rubrivivax sp. A210]
MERKLQLALAASAAGLSRGLPSVEAFLAERAVAAPARLRVAMLLEEAVMNVAMHGLAQPESHELQLSVGVHSDRVELVIEDDGVAFDPVTAALPTRPASLAEASPGGLGIRLMRRFASRLHYQRHDGRNRLTLDVGRD